MEFFVNNILLTMFFPIWISLVIITSVVFKISSNRKMTLLFTLISTFIGLIFSLGLFKYVRIPNTLIIEKNILWMPFESLNFYIGTLIDSTSTSFLMILMIVSFLIQLYSYGYMKDKRGFSKYYIYLNFFNFSMIGLLLSTNLVQMYIFWELVGIASYLLIGFYYNREDVSKSAQRVFIINRIGDCALLAGIIIFIYISQIYLNQTNTDILAFTNMDDITSKMALSAYPEIFNTAGILMIIGAFVKSAQFPFHIWLTDAMKAPTPISALIHSATMVCMGIFLIIRIYPIISPEIFNIILLFGAITAFLCAFIAITQTNIKKMLAYSTSSQLGLIFIALGLYSIPVAIIYMIIHAFTKSILFLSAGIIEKKYNNLNINELGNVRKNDFYLALYWLIGSLSLSGLFFGGFTAKELLIKTTHNTNCLSVLIIILLTSYLSTFYIFKSYFLIFENKSISTNIEVNNNNEKSMTMPIIALCFFVIIPGFIFKLNDINYLCLISIAIGGLAIINAYSCYKCNKIFIPKLLYKLSYNELYIPNVYNCIKSCFNKLFKITIIIEKYIFEGINFIIGKITAKSSDYISKIQNGNIQNYVAYSIFSTSIILLSLILFYFIILEVN